jgi:hypothetical protein
VFIRKTSVCPVTTHVKEHQASGKKKNSDHHNIAR